MDRYDRLYELYDRFDATTIREYQEFVDLFPAVDSRAALEHWRYASDELARMKADVAEALPDGETLAEVAAHATESQSFLALDLYQRYGRAVNVLVLDVDETLRSAGGTDNEIPRDTLHLLTEFCRRDVPLVICTGQTLENVKGFLVQGLGNELVHSGRVSVVYEGGMGVFTPGHGSWTKRLLYERLDEDVRTVFDGVRARARSAAPEAVRRGCHLQGNEFNVTLKPNYETGSEAAVAVVERALVHLLDLLEACVTGERRGWARAHYAAADPEIAAALAGADRRPEASAAGVPDDVAATFERVRVGYYEGDAAELASGDVTKADGMCAAFEVLGIDDPFVFVMGDSRSDLDLMEWVSERDAGLVAAPDTATPAVLDHVTARDDLVFTRSADALRTVYALDRFAALD